MTLEFERCVENVHRTFLLNELEKMRIRRSDDYLSPIEALRAMVHFEHFSFSGVDLDGWRVGGGLFIGTDLPKEPRETYFREGYIAFDPILRSCSPETPIASWEDCDPGDQACENERRVIDFFHQEGVKHRTVVTLWNEGRVYGSATFFHSRSFSKEERAVVSLLSEPIHAVLAKPAWDVLNRHLRLSKGAIECLKFAKRGLTSEDISSATSYSYETVNTYLKSATRKLGATNRTHAVALGLHRRIIN